MTGRGRRMALRLATVGAVGMLGALVFAPPLSASVSLVNTATLQSELPNTAFISDSNSVTETSGVEATTTVEVTRTASATTQVDQIPIAQVPTLSPAGIALCCLLLAAAALVRLRRETERR